MKKWPRFRLTSDSGHNYISEKEDFQAALNPLCTLQVKQHEWKCGMWRVFVIVWIQASVRWRQKTCTCKRNITLSSAANFKQALGSSKKYCFDFYVFFKSLFFEKSSHCTSFVFRCLWQHYWKSIVDALFFLGWFGIQISSVSSSGTD